MMLFIWCFVSTLAPYPMNSFFVSFFKFVRSIVIVCVGLKAKLL